MRKLTRWESRFVEMAELVSTWSKDPNTKIGAVIALPFSRQVLSTGYNGLPRGVNDNLPERSERPEKYFWYGHAERNAVYNAARFGTRLTGSVIYLNAGMPCTGCAIAIIQAGIAGVICMDGDPTGEPNPKWDAEAQRSRVMLKEAGVALKHY